MRTGRGCTPRRFIRAGPIDPEEELNRRRELWEIWGDEILEEFCESHPGLRPWGWWRFQAPEPRRKTGPGAYDIEDELAYLGRLSLLTERERSLLASRADGDDDSVG